MKLYLTRHGETEENKLGILQGHMPGKLSREGVEQAKALGQKLRSEHFDYIYASDLGRVVATAAEVTCFHPDTPVIFTKELRERDFGELTGKSRHDLKVESGLDVEPEQGESKSTYFTRAKSVLDSMLKKHPKDSLLLICHGGIGQAILAQIYGKDYTGMLEMEKLGNTSLSIFEINPDGSYQELCYNSTDHLRDS